MSLATNVRPIAARACSTSNAFGVRLPIHSCSGSPSPRRMTLPIDAVAMPLKAVVRSRSATSAVALCRPPPSPGLITPSSVAAR